MSASQLLRILQTLPAGTDEEICVFNTDEPEATTDRTSKFTNPFLSNEENTKSNFCCNPELESSIFRNDFNNNLEHETFRKSTTPCNIPSGLFEKTNGFYIDKNSVECELPELMVCYQESDFQVKDICIDEGIPNEETSVCNSFPLSEDDDDMIEASLDSDFLNHEWLRPSYITTCEEKLNPSTNSVDDVSTEQQDWSLTALEFPPSSDIYADDVGQQTLQGPAGVKLSYKSEIEESEAFHFDTRKPTTYSDPGGAMNSDLIYELPIETQNGVHHHDQAMTAAHHERRHVGESSFSMAGVITELISCSRPITFAGGISMSNLSDSSATSTRSFAFPTLEGEYSSSPVRMGKAERRRLRKQKGWGQGLLCCKF